MRQRTRRLILYILTAILLMLCVLDTLLRLVDPLGIRRYANQVRAMYPYIIPVPNGGYTYTPGEIQIPYYEAHTNVIGTRPVPYMNPLADCVLVTIGDSVTWGAGVEDDETFTARLALLFPDVRWLNAGHNGYGVEEIAASIDLYPAQGYIYLQIKNDFVAAEDWRLYKPFPNNWLVLADYWQLMTRGFVGFSEPPLDNPALWTVINTLVEREDVLTFGFDTPLAHATKGLIILPAYEPLSAYDAHPNTAGHQQIADAMYPYLIEFIERTCA